MLEHARSGIYRIRHRDSGKTYIGQAANIRTRWRHHVWALSCGRHDNHYLQAAWDKYGAEAFDFSVVLYCRVPLLTENEQAALDGIPPDLRYNVGLLVESPNQGRKFDPDHRRKIGDGNRGKKRTPAQRARLSEAKKGIRPDRSHSTWASSVAAASRRRWRPVVVIYPDGLVFYPGVSVAAQCMNVSSGAVQQSIRKGTRLRGVALVRFLDEWLEEKESAPKKEPISINNSGTYVVS